MNEEITTNALRFGAVMAILGGAVLYAVVRWAAGVGRWPVVAGLLVAGVVLGLGGVVTDRHQYGAVGLLSLFAVATVAAITPSGIGTRGAVVLVVLGLVELLLAPAYSGIAGYGEKVGEWLR